MNTEQIIITIVFYGGFAFALWWIIHRSIKHLANPDDDLELLTFKEFWEWLKDRFRVTWGYW